VLSRSLALSLSLSLSLARALSQSLSLSHVASLDRSNTERTKELEEEITRRRGIGSSFFCVCEVDGVGGGDSARTRLVDAILF
jgi:hypothetical protein